MKKILSYTDVIDVKFKYSISAEFGDWWNEFKWKDIQYLSAWTSLAVYNDKFSLLARDILKSNGWNIRFYNEQIAKSDVKYLLADEKK